jgi:hypothetical protein
MANTRTVFGLPLSPIKKQYEPASARRARLEALDALVRTVFQLSKFHLGEDEARELFIKTAQLKRGKRAGAGRRDEILRLWDALMANNPHMKQVAPRLIARKLHQTYGPEFGLSPTAIEKTIRRTLNNRKRNDAETLRLTELFRAEGNYAGQLTEQFQEVLTKRLDLYPGRKKGSKNPIVTRARTRKPPD